MVEVGVGVADVGAAGGVTAGVAIGVVAGAGDAVDAGVAMGVVVGAGDDNESVRDSAAVGGRRTSLHSAALSAMMKDVDQLVSGRPSRSNLTVAQVALYSRHKRDQISDTITRFPC